jgi:hypothetical protein
VFVEVVPGLPVGALPPAILRRAAEFVAELSGSPLAPLWGPGRLGPIARALYRPDLGAAEPAYYEVAVIGQAIPPQIQGAAPAQQPIDVPAGYIILATGAHDLPIAHWHAEGPTLTDTMREQAFENDRNNPVRFYKLDALGYAAEDSQGREVATLGTPLLRIVGATPELLEQYGGESSAEWTPDPAGGEGTLTETGPGVPEGFELTGWESFEALKAGYAESYAPYIADLRDLAAEFWEAEREAAQFGIGLRRGEVYTLALAGAAGATPPLAAVPTVVLSGPGADLVSGELIDDGGPLPFYRITVNESTPGVDVPFTATVTYSGGPTETFNFFVIDELYNRVYVPLAAAGTGATADAQATGGPALAQSWGSWRFWWAGNNADQRIYRQLRANEAPSTSSCVSGCGATAWAMLFGWVDRMAHNNVAPWRSSTGIYRTDGGRGSAAAIAPRDMNRPLTTEQRGAANMTWEIRNHVGTFCAFGNGATFPWRMSDARRYLAGRSANPIRTDYSSVGIRRDSYRNRAISSIVNRGTPAIIGTGWLNHYPLAYGYAERTRRVRKCNIFGFNCSWRTEVQRSFFVNQGWAGSADNLAWVSSGTWFAGQVFPAP